MGHHVTGVDREAFPETLKNVDEFAVGDLEDGIPAEVGTGYDVVIAADVLEHLRHPEELMDEITRVLRPDGRLIVSVPNFGHWYPRTRTLVGAFDYDQRGILDKTHYRFFTRKSLARMVQRAGFEIRRHREVGLPFDVLSGDGGSVPTRLLRSVDKVAVSLRPTLFAYQFVWHLQRPSAPSVLSRARAAEGAPDETGAVSAG
jgi:SAM-dependent methyltransferase